jgi:transposase
MMMEEAKLQELLSHMKSTQNKAEYIKCKIIHLYLVEQMPVEEISKVTDKSKSVIYGIAHRYNKLGLQGLINKPRGGRKWAYMSFDEEKELLDEVSKDAEKGLVVISKVIKVKAEAKLGRTVSDDYAQDLLNRHGWRKVTPRTKHPKSTEAEQEEFKKKFKIMWKKQPTHLNQVIIGR